MVGTHWDGKGHPLVNHAARCRSAHPTLTAASQGIKTVLKDSSSSSMDSSDGWSSSSPEEPLMYTLYSPLTAPAVVTNK